jgi:hypothetical protein
VNCQKCKAHLYPHQTRCKCGNVNRNLIQMPTIQNGPPRVCSPNALQRMVAERLRLVSEYVTKRKREHPGESAKDACLHLLRKKGLTKLLPDVVRKQVEKV